MKKTVTTTIAAVFFLTSSITAFAQSGNIKSTSWFFSPSSGTWTYTSDSTHVDLNLDDLSYKKSSIDEIKERYVDGLYPGFDIKDVDRDKSQLDSAFGSTNLPNPKYDHEDDNGDGYDDEVEVVSREPKDMKSTKDYYFHVSFKKKEKSGTGQLQASSHASLRSFSTGEYQTWEYEDLKWQKYDLSKKVSLSAKTKVDKQEQDQKHKINEIEDNQELLFSEEHSKKGYNLSAIEKINKKVKVYISPDKENLKSYVKENKEIAERIIENGESDIPVVITFKKPQSLEELIQFENNYDFKLSEYVGRAFGEDNERITYSGKEKDFASIDSDFIQNNIGKNNEVAGIFALYGSISSSSQLENLLNNREVYLIDVMQNELQEHEQLQSFNSDLPIEFEVHTPYWYIEKE